jgi:hypothetical protein
MRHLPVALQAVLALEPQVISWAEDFARMENACSWAGACTTPLRWKARSSSRKSATSTPRPTRLVNSSTAPWRW